MQEAVEAFWNEFSSATGCTATFEAWAFGGGDTPDLADELAELVLHGPKRATASAYQDAVADDDLPVIGGYSVILDSKDSPVSIIRTTRIDLVPFGEVDEQFAWDEGEGDRSLEWWRAAHIHFLAGKGCTLTDETLLVLERFEMVWRRAS